MRDVRRVDRCDSGSHKIKKFLFYKIEIVYCVGAVALEKCFYYYFFLVALLITECFIVSIDRSRRRRIPFPDR